MMDGGSWLALLQLGSSLSVVSWIALLVQNQLSAFPVPQLPCSSALSGDCIWVSVPLSAYSDYPRDFLLPSKT